MRPPVSVRMKALKPPAWSPSSAVAGSWQSWNTISTVSEPRRPIFFSRLPTRKPGVAVSMMNAEMPLVPLLESVRAVKVTYFATLPFVM